MDQVQRVLQQHWGYDSFRPLQESSIRAILERRDSLTVMPTGGGKSLCFQAPAACSQRLAIVVSPLIALMHDQVETLQRMGVRAALINSTQDQRQKQRVANQIRCGELQLLYLAPEKLLSPRTLGFLREQDVAYFAIDECHCVSQWGHDFRPEYRQLASLRRHFPNVPVHAFTATASQAVQKDIVKQLAMNDPVVLIGEFDRPNLTYRMIRADDKLAQISEVIRRHPRQSGIVYCISRREVEQTAAALQTLGHDALAYHASLSAEERTRAQQAFMSDPGTIMVATVAFGMGVNKSDVRFVVHAGMPKSVEHYQQESGRAGRDGQPAECVLLHSPRDLVLWKDMAKESNNEHADRSLQTMFGLCNAVTCRRKIIIEYFGQQHQQERCGACDVCLGELQRDPDSNVIAQSVLSAISELHEKFGARYVSMVLAGKRDHRITNAEHDRLPSFASLSAHGLMTIQVWIDQLNQQGMLRRRGDYRTLALTAKGKRLLSDQEQAFLTVGRKPARKTTVMKDRWTGVDKPLFESLSRLRSEIAETQEVAPFAILGDGLLRQMARVRPATRDGLARLDGMRAKRFEKFGLEFFQTLDEECLNRHLSRDQPALDDRFIPRSASIAAFDFFRTGDSVDAVAKKMSKAKSTVLNYLTDYIRHHRIGDPTPWVQPQVAAQIFAHKHLADSGKLKPLFDRFEGKISYEDIKITLACDE